MKSLRLVIYLLVTASIIFLGSTFIRQKSNTKAPKSISIEGTYRFFSRKIVDGKVVKPSATIGMLTFTKKYRVFNFMWVDSSGKHNSESIVSKYKLTDKEYTETFLYSAAYHENDLDSRNNGVTFDTNYSKSVPVTIKGPKISFKDVFSGLTLIFERNKMAAVAKGMFTDYWVKVK